jgi:hypothetical protein
VASLLLGMRHVTDPDHIVVGAAIVLYELAFTPRLGLSMEFSCVLHKGFNGNCKP